MKSLSIEYSKDCYEKHFPQTHRNEYFTILNFAHRAQTAPSWKRLLINSKDVIYYEHSAHIISIKFSREQEPDNQNRIKMILSERHKIDIKLIRKDYGKAHTLSRIHLTPMKRNLILHPESYEEHKLRWCCALQMLIYFINVFCIIGNDFFFFPRFSAHFSFGLHFSNMELLWSGKGLLVMKRQG